jgi:hypothetical protein
MKITERMHLQKEPCAEPLFELHLDLTQMTEREMINAMLVIHHAIPKFDVVLRKGEP